MSYQFERVVSSDEQINKLYDLLKQRTYVISHRNLPSYGEHSDFVKNHPYLHWFMVSDEFDCYGSFYIKKDNSIGLNLKITTNEILAACVNFIQHNFMPRAAQLSMVPDFFYINVAHSNKQLRDALKDLGLSPLQISFRM